MPEPDDNLVTLMTARTEFEANAIVALLESEGIEAFAFGTAHAAFGISLERGLRGVPVQVRAEDLDTAREAVERRREESDAIDWEQIDVGSRDDDLPLHQPASMPMPARIALIATMLVAIIAIIGMLVMVFLPWPRP